MQKGGGEVEGSVWEEEDAKICHLPMKGYNVETSRRRAAAAFFGGRAGLTTAQSEAWQKDKCC